MLAASLVGKIPSHFHSTMGLSVRPGAATSTLSDKGETFYSLPFQRINQLTPKEVEEFLDCQFLV
jgi:hypothetical protein